MIGEVMVDGLAKVPSGNPIVVQMNLTLDGTLSVAARERATGLQKVATFENALAKYEREEKVEAQERLQRLWDEAGSPADEDEDEEEAVVAPGGAPAIVAGPGDGHRETVQARALLEKADRLMAKVPQEDRGEVQKQMDKVRTAMTDRAWERLTAATNELADTLFYLEE